MADDHGRPGVLLLCRSAPAAVGPIAQVMRERMLLAPAGPEWSVLVPEARPWLAGEGPVDLVANGWASALAVGAPWPVLALWWDEDRAGFVLASGFRRTVGYVWLSNGTPAGEAEALSSFVARLGLDPVLDLQSLDALARPDADADARARLRGLLAVLARDGLVLPAGLAPGMSQGEPAEAGSGVPGSEAVEWAGWRKAVRDELSVVDGGPGGPWLRLLGWAQVGAGVPVLLYAARRRSAAWAALGAVLVVNGAVGVGYGVLRPGD